mgnify:CR=1 FL=1
MNLETSLVRLIRRDLAVSPFAPTVLDKLNEAGIDTYAVGKINDIFNGAGINHDMGHNKSNSHGIDNLIKAGILQKHPNCELYNKTLYCLVKLRVTNIYRKGSKDINRS